MLVTSRMKSFLKPVISVHGHKLSFKQVENGSVIIVGGRLAELNAVFEKTNIKVPEIIKSCKTVIQHFPIMEKSTIGRSWSGI